MPHKDKFTSSRFINFLGGYNLLYALIVSVLACVVILLLNMVSFIFTPILVVITSVLTPMLLAIIFYYMFVPLVDFLYLHNVPRTIGASISILLLFILIIAGFGLAIPIIVNQIISFAQAVPTFANNLVAILEQYIQTAEFQSYYQQIIHWITNSLNDVAQQLVITLSSTVQGITTILSTISSLLIVLLTFPIFLLFLLVDGRNFKNNFLYIFPTETREDIDQLTKRINLKVGAYIKGRLLVSFLIGVFYFVTLSILKVDYSFVLALLSGVLSLIPYLGAIISLVPLLIVSLTQSTLTAIIVLIIWGIAQVLDGNILGPSIISRNLNMHPLTIMIILIGSGSLLGIVGMVIGIPIYAILREIALFFFDKYQKRYIRFFKDTHDTY